MNASQREIEIGCNIGERQAALSKTVRWIKLISNALIEAT
jgi:hypothetical protein